MKTLVTVIWNDRYCGDMSSHIVEAVTIKGSAEDIRKMSTDAIIRVAAFQYYRRGCDSDNEARESVKDIIKDYGFVGVILGVPEWLH